MEEPAPETVLEVADSGRRAKALWIALLGVWLLALAHYGAVAPGSVSATAFALALLNALAMLLLPGGIRLSRLSLAWLGAVAAVFLLQLLPLGPVLFPVTHALREKHGVGGLWPGTADAFLTARCLAQMGAYVLTALLVIRLRDAGLSSSFMMKGIAGVLALEAAYGVVQHFAGLREVPFYGPRATPDAASGTMVNRNTFGGLMAMGAVASAGLAYSRFAWSRGTAEAKAGNRVESGLLWSLVTALFVFCLVLSQSRGAALGAVVGALMIPFLFMGRANAIGALAVLAIGSVAVALADPSILLGRFEQIDPFEIQQDSRVRIWTSTLQAALHQPILGFGVGTHPHAYHPYQPLLLSGQIHHSHNEFVNFFFEGGAVFLVVMAGGLAFWGFNSWKAMQRLPGLDRFLPTVALCAATAEAVHSVVDFDCRVTAAGMLFAMLVGLAAAVARPRAEPGKAVWAAAAAVALLAAGALFIRPLDTDSRVQQALASEPAAAASILRQALGLSPYQFQAAWVLAKSDDLRGDTTVAAGRYLVASDLWPAHPGLQKDAGLWFWDQWAETGERAYYDRSALAFQRLFTQQPRGVLEVMGGIWEEKRPLEEYERLMPPDRPAAAGTLAAFLASKGRWAIAQDLFDRSVPRSRENVMIFDQFANALRDAGQWGMEAVVRDRRLEVYSEPGPIAASAQAWARLQAWDRALERATQACRMDPATVGWVTLKGEIHRMQGDLDKALECWIKAAQLAPPDAGFLSTRATLYTEMRLHAEAAADYRQILRIKPGDRAAVFGVARSLAAAKDLGGARRVLDEFLAKNPADAGAAALRAELGN